MVRIAPFTPADQPAILDLILSIQRDEYGIAISAADQPDLTDIEDFYLPGAGGFWVAHENDRLVGTIALKDIGAGQAALRKMFVAASHRGAAAGVAQGLLDTLIAAAGARGLSHIYLGTTDLFLAAHRFYEKNGFALMQPEALPSAFPRMAVDSRFYALTIA
ncbi:N-acetylglutamate synthase, GNAT family [Sphingobium sp. AP50]|uniref:GNAT family N-acetyltransferase n=1 Tax=Sphingobium sp. AP50 TaxID=1884369 RepID=UPI0008C9459A|nr:GNAT family N-acetyltransferase [Sphingobium sp. AP50]SEI73203.1 N-acetylglutamate synthase, GNAT family [Sphingobium sp. AP50]